MATLRKQVRMVTIPVVSVIIEVEGSSAVLELYELQDMLHQLDDIRDGGVALMVDLDDAMIKALLTTQAAELFDEERWPDGSIIPGPRLDEVTRLVDGFMDDDSPGEVSLS